MLNSEPSQSEAGSRSVLAGAGPEAALKRRWPKALSISLGSAFALTVIAFLVARAPLARGRHKVLIVGDSIVAGYRCGVNQCIEDRLNQELGRDWNVRNFAEPGAQLNDYYLMLSKAELLGFEPEVVVITLPPKKLVLSGELTNDGTNLRWLPLNREGLEFYGGLQRTRSRPLLLLRKASLLFGFYEGLSSLWERRFAFPGKRRAMLRESRETRHKRMLLGAQKIVDDWGRYIHAVNEQTIAASTAASSRELDFFIGVLRKRHIRPVIFIPPWPRDELVKAGFAADALAKFDVSYAYLRRWCRERGLSVVDTSDSRAFESDDWDDFQHVRTPQAFEHLATPLKDWISANHSDTP